MNLFRAIASLLLWLVVLPICALAFAIFALWTIEEEARHA